MKNNKTLITRILIALFYIVLVAIRISYPNVDPMALIAPGTMMAGCVGGWFLFKGRRNLLFYIGIYLAAAVLFYIERLGGYGLFMAGHILKFLLMGMLIAYSMRSKKLRER